jgi:capsular exopolysaccharide synthesis family protein
MDETAFLNSPDPAMAFMGGITSSALEGTQIIQIGYAHSNPLKATKFANALAKNYIQQDLERRISGLVTAEKWLESGLREMHKKVQDSENTLIDYIKKNEIVSVPDIEAKSQSMLDSLKSTKVDIENQIAETSKRYKEKHPKLIALKTRLEAINISLDEESKKIFLLNEKIVQYSNLKREVDSNRTLYESLLKKTKETEVSKELTTTDLRILDLAEVPSAPIRPNRKRDITTGAMWGMLLGLGLAFFIEYLDSTLKNAEDVESYVKLPFLGYVPSLRSEAVEVREARNVDLISEKSVHSRITEAYRSIRTSIIFSSPQDKPLKSILITSCLPQEGKTFVSINLGIVFAHTNEPIVLVEADMRRPRISAVFGMNNNVGLSSFLAGEATIDEVIRPTEVPNLSFISSGPLPPNPTELLSSVKTHELLEVLESRFSRVIVDSPPVLSVADTLLLANLVDGVITVIRASYTNIGPVLRARQRLHDAKSRIIGVILNHVNVKREDSYYYYHYYYSRYPGEKEKKKF